jgi:transcriptional regulator with XRE-family HTH domain
MTLGERLKSLREMRGLSRSELARRAHVHRPTIIELEEGRQKDVGVSIAIRLAKALGVKLELLVGEDDGQLEPASTALVGA